MVTSRVLNRVGLVAMGLPLSTWLVVEALSRAIPDCHLRMYGGSECIVGGLDLGMPLVFAWLGGFFLFFLLTAFVSLPLFVVAWLLSWRAARRGNNCA